MGSEIHHSVRWRPHKSYHVGVSCVDLLYTLITHRVFRWGESAGAISVSLHMLTNGGNPGGLFRAAFMESGAPIPVGDITNGQKYYDALVADTGCSSASDTLACLRTIPFSVLKAAINKSPGIFAFQVSLRFFSEQRNMI